MVYTKFSIAYKKWCGILFTDFKFIGNKSSPAFMIETV